MRVKSAAIVIVMLLPHVVFAARATDAAISAKRSSLELQSDTETPDGSLKPGKYTIRISDHLADRMIVEIQGDIGGIDKKFLAVSATNLTGSTPIGPVLANGKKGKAALRGFSFSKGNVVEFVYPKKDAVALAEANGVTVLAIDPASEGMRTVAGMSPEDMKIVTLWLLTPTPISPGDSKAGIQAARYAAPNSSLKLHAEVRPPVLPHLPKTGSKQPLFDLLGLCSLGIATLLTLRRSRFGTI